MPFTPVQQFFYYLNQLGWKDRYYELMKGYGVTSIKNLTAQQQEELADNLEREWKERCKRPRGTVIHYLCIMPGYEFKRNGEPDYEKINAWVASKMNGRILNKLSLKELNTCVSMVKQWYKKQLKP